MSGDPQNLVCPCNSSWCGIGAPPACPYHGVQTVYQAATAAPAGTGWTFPLVAPSLSDDDIERIAKRLAELLKGSTETI